MGVFSKPAVAVIILAAAIGAISVGAKTVIGATKPNPENSVFGISAKDSVYFYKRQAAWKEGAMGRHSVAPPRPNVAFFDYAVSSDPDSKKICAVYAATTSPPAIATLEKDLSLKHSEPLPTPANGKRWNREKGYVEIENIDGVAHILWDFTGNCFAKNKALYGDVVTSNPQAYSATGKASTKSP